MLHIDPFTIEDYRRLAGREGEAIAIFLPTTPISVRVNENRIRFKSLARGALEMARDAGFNSADAAQDAFAALEEDYAFWSNQAHGLAVLSIDGELTKFRLAYPVAESAEVSARLHLKPMLPALNPKIMWVLTISDGCQRARNRDPGFSPKRDPFVVGLFASTRGGAAGPGCGAGARAGSSGQDLVRRGV